MAIEIVQVFTRPDLTIPWFQDTLPDSHRQYWQDTYITPGLLTAVREESQDGLTLTVKLTFPDEVAQSTFSADEYFRQKAAERDAYNLQHGIVRIV